MFTISKPKPEDATMINEIIKKSWYNTYINEQVGITKEDVDIMYSKNEEKQIEMIRIRAKHQRNDDVSLVARDEENVVGFIRLKIGTNEIELLSLYIDPEKLLRLFFDFRIHRFQKRNSVFIVFNYDYLFAFSVQ